MKLTLFIGLVSLIFLTPTAASAQMQKATGYNLGDKAEDFALKNVDGKKVTLADYKDVKGYIIVFTCNHCPYAKMYEERLIGLHKKYAPQGFPVIAINPNDPEIEPEDSFGMMKSVAKKKKYPFAYLLDEGQKIYPKFGATRTPHIFILDKELILKYMGAIDDNAEDATKVYEKFAERAINSLLAGKDPEPGLTKAIGCTIKAKKKG